jgi:hypothetical protein
VAQLRQIAIVIKFKAVVVAALACASMLLCRSYGLTAKLPLTLIATAVIFPIVFSISGVYKRREAALDKYGEIKAHSQAIYFAARDWIEENHNATRQRIKRLMGDLLLSCHALFTAPLDQMPAREEAVYRNFRTCRCSSMAAGQGPHLGEVSRCNQYLTKMIVYFVKHIYQYRTSVTLRTYSEVFTLILLVLYGPYFLPRSPWASRRAWSTSWRSCSA